MGEHKRYTSDLTDSEWQRIEPLLPDDKLVGRLRAVALRDVLDAIFYRTSLRLKVAADALLKR